MTTTVEQQSSAIQQVISAWQGHNQRLNTILDKLSDDELYNEVAPGRNRGTYLLGHLIASNDSMIRLFGLGDRLYPSYDSLFLANPDNREASYPSASTLRADWNNLNSFLEKHFAALTPDEWYAKHTSVSDADFAINPQRNKLNVLINRTNHLAYHLGQFAFLL